MRVAQRMGTRGTGLVGRAPWPALIAGAALIAACSPKVRETEGTGATGTGATGTGTAGGTGGDTSTTSSGSTTTSTTTACVAESDGAFCSRLGKTCDMLTDVDNCGAARTASCGACTGIDVCLSNVCHTPVCANLTYNLAGVPVSGMAQSGVQDAIAAVSADGSTLLFQRSGSCGGFSLFIGDESPPGSGSYAIQDISSVLGQMGMDTSEEPRFALSGDGLTIVGTDAGSAVFLATTRSALGAIDFGMPVGDDYAALAAGAGQTLTAPVLSYDGLAFYYAIKDPANAANAGIYESVRASTGVPFPPATRMSDEIQANAYVSGISSDRLALFLQTQSYGTVVLSRTSLDAPFTNSHWPDSAPTVPGFRTHPTADCTRLFGTCTPGGCQNEDVCVYGH